MINISFLSKRAEKFKTKVAETSNANDFFDKQLPANKKKSYALVIIPIIVLVMQLVL